ncbi:DEAD/DEAH box helicase [bacterium]|nr:DEAD/DEAH box helicase [bacterium]
MTRATQFFKPDGPLAKVLPGYEHRPQQTTMAAAIEEALSHGQRLLLEAGTGVGKSLAYLVPAILWAQKHKKRVVVSTWTRTLQHQLVRKDLPLLKQALDVDFDFQLCVGGENYLCPRRLDLLLAEESKKLLGSIRLGALRRWANKTEEGLRSELRFPIEDEIWRQVCRHPDFCHPGVCNHGSKCFFQKMKRRAAKAHILVVNHYLLLSNVKSEGVLPEYDALIVDEAHNLEGVASDYLGDELSEPELLESLYWLGGPNRKGWLTSLKVDSDLLTNLLVAAERVVGETRSLFEGVDRWLGPSLQRRFFPDAIPPLPDNPWKELGDRLETAAKALEDEAQRGEALACRARLGQWYSVLSRLRTVKDDGLVRWAARDRQGKGHLFLVPLDIGPSLREMLYKPLSSVVQVSATLTVRGDFSFLAGRLGMDEARTLAVPSGFDYRRQCIFYVPPEGPDPRDTERFVRFTSDQIMELSARVPGGCFALFTSLDTLARTHADLLARYPGHWRGLEEEGRDDCRLLLSQLEYDREILIEAFEKDGHAVLLGAATFWQGLDIPGAALSGIIITKLPFAVPDDPLNAARLEALQRAGRDGFRELTVPAAVITFLQGFGRLIRNHTDRGVVAVLDRRLVEKKYGETFLGSLPNVYKTHQISKLEQFFGAGQRA